MLEYQNATTALMEVLFTPKLDMAYLERQLEVSTKIAVLIRSSKAQTTIDDIVSGLFAEYKVDDTAIKLHEDVTRHLVFAAIGWTSMLYTANFESDKADFATTTEATLDSSQGRRQLAQSSRRPIGAMLRSCGLMPIACPPGVAQNQGVATLLAVTHLNYFSLSTLGDVTIVWVDDLSKHCEFDRYSKKKELKLFRLPTMCAMMCLDDGEALIGR